MEALKPCPNPWTSIGTPHENKPRSWISPPEVYIRPVLDGKIRYRIECGCGVKGPLCDTEEEAVAAWNTRPDRDGLVKALRFARTALRNTRALHPFQLYENTLAEIDAALRGEGETI